MPLLYAINGRLERFDEEIISPVSPVFKTILAEKMGSPLSRDSSRREFVPPKSVQASYREVSAPPVQKHRAVLAADLMSVPVQTLHPDSTLEEAFRFMKERNFRHIPVISSLGELVGIISDRDILGASNHGVIEKADKGLQVENVMTKKVLSATPSTPIREIAETMLQKKISAIPIVNEGGRLVGILTGSDILRGVVSHEPVDLWA